MVDYHTYVLLYAASQLDVLRREGYVDGPQLIPDAKQNEVASLIVEGRGLYGTDIPPDDIAAATATLTQPDNGEGV